MTVVGDIIIVQLYPGMGISTSLNQILNTVHLVL